MGPIHESYVAEDFDTREDVELEGLSVEELALADTEEDLPCEGTVSPEQEVVTCEMCDKEIEGQYLTALGTKLHPHCFCCVNCRTKISPGQDFFECSEKSLCVACYYELYGHKCKVWIKRITNFIILKINQYDVRLNYMQI